MISIWIFVLMHHTPVKSIGYVTDWIEILCCKHQLPSMTSKRSHHSIKLVTVIVVSIQKKFSLQ